MTRMCKEVIDKLKLFIPSPNNRQNTGDERDKWVPNPKANSVTDFDNFYRLGMVLAFCWKIRECLEVNLPSIFWQKASTMPSL